ncbi:MAG: NAD(P)/FAD-dependent oxidoreductase [Dehalococcoidales bacterium]|nr:NAD(P)/FAD-dependent oxidoreductase [Dehalococcoidales bacterium]
MTGSILIVGAGIAGLSAGCYGQMNGYQTQIFEQGHNPGGLCTSWKRKVYTIDGCIHWLVGSAPNGPLHQIWLELGAIQGRSFFNHDTFMRVEGDGSRAFVVYTDADRLEQHMKEIAPEDEETIETFVDAIRTCARYELPVGAAFESRSFKDGLNMVGRLPLLKMMAKWGRISVRDFATRFRNPFLSEAFATVFGDINNFPMAGMIMTLAWLHNRAAGYPIGGSLEFARAIERRYLGLGGEIHYDSRVEKILVENDSAVGIRLVNGQEYRGDVVISAADGHSTIFNMLGARYMDDEVRSRYDRLPIFPPLLYVALGVTRTFDDFPASVVGVSFPLRKPIMIDNKILIRLTAQVYNFDPFLAHHGRTVVRVMLMSNYERWSLLAQSPDEYNTEKERVAEQVIAALEQRFPGISDQIEMSDVATPMTFEHYTGNWNGSFEGWLLTVDTFGKNVSKTLPGLDNFYMIGQWVNPGGGVPPAAMDGRSIIQLLRHKDKAKFLSSQP